MNEFEKNETQNQDNQKDSTTPQYSQVNYQQGPQQDAAPQYSQVNYQQDAAPQYSQVNYQQESQFNQPYVSQGYVQTEQPVKKKHSKKPLVIVLVIVLVLAAGVGSAFAFAGDYTRNLIALYTKSDMEYFEWVEKNSIDRDVENMVAANELTKSKRLLLKDGVTVNSKLDIRLAKTLTDMLEMPEVAKLGFDMTVGMSGKQVGTEFAAIYKDVDLVRADAFIDAESKRLLFEIPSYKEGLLDGSMLFDQKAEDGRTFGEILDEVLAAGGIEIKEMTSEEMKSFLSSYAYLVVDSVEEVTLTKGEKLTAGEKEASCTIMSYSFDTKQLMKLVIDLMTMMKSDEMIMTKLESFKVSRDDYQEMITEMISDLEELDISEYKNKLEVDVYVDNEGFIIGRKLKTTVDEQKINLEYITIDDGKEKSATATLSVGGAKAVTLSSYGTYTDGMYNGETEIKPGAMVSAVLNADLKLKIKSENVLKTKEKMSGKYTIAIECSGDGADKLGLGDITDYALCFSYEGDEETYTADIIVLKDDEDIINISTASSINTEDVVVPLQTSESKIYDIETDLAEYTTPKELIGYVIALKEKINDPTFDTLIEQVLNSALGGISYDDIKGYYDSGMFDGITFDAFGTIDVIDDPVIDDPIIDDPIIDDPVIEDPVEGDITVDTSKNYYYSGLDLAGYAIPGEYKGLTYNNSLEITDEQYAEAEEEFLMYSDTYRLITDRGAQMGDEIYFDVALVIAGTPIEDYSYEGCYTTLGNYDYGEGVDDQLVGANVGDTITVEATLGEQYGVYAGFTGSFAVTIIEIYQMCIPEFTEEYIVDFLGYESLEACREEIKAEIISVRQNITAEDIAYALVQQAKQNTTYIEIPEDVLQNLYDAEIEEYTAWIKSYYGYSLDEYLTEYNWEKETFEQYIYEDACYRAKDMAFYAAIAKAENLYMFTGQEYADMIDNYMLMYGYTDYGEMLDYITEKSIVDSAIVENIEKLISDTAIITQ